MAYPRNSLFPGAVLSLCALATSAGSPVAPGLIDPTVASTEELAELPGPTETLVEAILSERPFANAEVLDAFLAKRELDDDARATIYAKAFLHIDLNTASSAEMQLIPGVGRRMAHEFEEYRPWKSWMQFDKEIGKYVDAQEVARLWRYVVISEEKTAEREG